MFGSHDDIVVFEKALAEMTIRAEMALRAANERGDLIEAFEKDLAYAQHKAQVAGEQLEKLLDERNLTSRSNGLFWYSARSS